MSEQVEIFENAALVARGHVDPSTGKRRDGFAVFGRSQMYWKGRSDAATDIREYAKGYPHRIGLK